MLNIPLSGIAIHSAPLVCKRADDLRAASAKQPIAI